MLRLLTVKYAITITNPLVGIRQFAWNEILHVSLHSTVGALYNVII